MLQGAHARPAHKLAHPPEGTLFWVEMMKPAEGLSMVCS